MRQNPERWLLLCGGLCMAMAAGASGGVFKWVDARGIVHYDDYSLQAERLTRASIARGLVDADPKATVPAELVAEVAHQCNDLKARRASMAEARILYARDPVGNQYRLSDNQVALERAVLAQQTTRYCRPLAAQYILFEARAAWRAEALKNTRRILEPQASEQSQRLLHIGR